MLPYVNDGRTVLWRSRDPWKRRDDSRHDWAYDENRVFWVAVSWRTRSPLRLRCESGEWAVSGRVVPSCAAASLAFPAVHTERPLFAVCLSRNANAVYDGVFLQR